MSHRIHKKEAARAARLRAEAEARRTEHRQRLLRRAGYAAIAVIAIALVAVAALRGGNGQVSPDHMAATTSGPAVGDTAPNFDLTNVVSGKPVTLAALHGRKALMFFSEGLGCQPCMIQAADLQKDPSVRKAGIQLVSVTTDSPGDLAQAAKQYGITTPLLSDPTTEMSSAYGMLGHGGMQHPTQDGHAFMLLSPSGKVLWHQAYQEMYVSPNQVLKDMQAQVRA